MKTTWKHKLLDRTALFGTAVVMTLASGLVLAQTDKEQGYEIAARSDRSDRGFADSHVEMKMILRNAAGRESVRTMKLDTLEIPDESTGDKTLIVFDSEFAFEDFTSLELNKFDYRYLRSEPCGDMQCDVLERYPRYEYSGYSKQVTWVDQQVFQIRKVEFHNRRGDLLKTLELRDYREYAGGIWRAHHLAMHNHQTGKSTALVYRKYEFGVGLEQRDFVKTALRRAR